MYSVINLYLKSPPPYKKDIQVRQQVLESSANTSIVKIQKLVLRNHFLICEYNVYLMQQPFNLFFTK